MNISEKEWAAGRIVFRIEIGPTTTIEVRECENGKILCSNSRWLVTHKRISEAEYAEQQAYARKIGAA